MNANAFFSRISHSLIFRLAAITLFLLLFSIFTLAKAEETNELYLTYDNSGIYAPKAEELHHQKLLAEAKKTRESLPAKDFPEGNWGESVNGLQLSLRFGKHLFTNGEPITAILLARNTTNRYVQYGATPNRRGNGDGPISFIATTAAGEVLKNEEPPWFIGGYNYMIAPQMQRKHLELLNEKYSLTNGTYFIHASVIIGVVKSAVGKPVIEWPEVKSADVPIKIEAPHAPNPARTD
jgi:hypothetical protein